MSSDGARSQNRPQRRIKRLPLIAAALLSTCLLAGAISAWYNGRLPTATAVADRLSLLEKARLAEAMQLRQELGNRVWSQWSDIDTPIIIYNEAYAFLVGYPDPPAGWRGVRSNEMHGTDWEPVPGDDFHGQVYYRQPLSDPSNTPQAFVVRVGDSWVASMTTKEWTEIALRAQIGEELPPPLAPIFPYALFTGAFDSDWYISALMHESFHAYQGVKATDYFLLAEEAHAVAERYPWHDSEFEKAWQRELDLLAESLSVESREEASDVAAQFLAQRDARRDAIDLAPELAIYEQQREWVEGLAKYTELEMWRVAGSTAGYEAVDELAADPDFNDYATYEKRLRQEIAQVRRMAGSEGDGRFYYSGWAQAVLLDTLVPGWKESVSNNPAPLETLLRAALGLQ